MILSLIFFCWNHENFLSSPWQESFRWRLREFFFPKNFQDIRISPWLQNRSNTDFGWFINSKHPATSVYASVNMLSIPYQIDFDLTLWLGFYKNYIDFLKYFITTFCVSVVFLCIIILSLSPFEDNSLKSWDLIIRSRIVRFWPHVITLSFDQHDDNI